MWGEVKGVAHFSSGLYYHWAFWQVGFPAVIVTDTGALRYPHHHQSTDTPDKLDFKRMARVVAGLEAAVFELAGAAEDEGP